MADSSGSEITITCTYYALCDRPAEGVTTHPILGYVPTCRHCAEKHELKLIPAIFEQGW